MNATSNAALADLRPCRFQVVIKLLDNDDEVIVELGPIELATDLPTERTTQTSSIADADLSRVAIDGLLRGYNAISIENRELRAELWKAQFKGAGGKNDA